MNNQLQMREGFLFYVNSSSSYILPLPEGCVGDIGGDEFTAVTLFKRII
jgi:hypothetical protein